MRLPRYAKYKDSGSSWLGKVPSHWDVQPCRNFVVEQVAKNEGAANQNYLSLMANVGVIPYEEKGDVGNKKPEDLSKCKLVSNGDLVINSMNYGIGSYGLSGLNGVCSPVYIVLRPRLERVRARFAFRIFENKAFQTYAQSFGNGILEHRAAINWDILKVIPVGLPSVDEQELILTFLDRETAKIDALIAEQEKLIVLLAEKRQATISHAVTRGLNPNTPMKASGIAWLGEVPAHWDVVPLRWYSKCRSGGAISTNDVEVAPDAEHCVPTIGGNGLMGFTDAGNVDFAVLAIGRVGALCGNVHVVHPPAWITDNALVLAVSARFSLTYLAYALRARNLNDLASKTAQPLVTGTQVSDQRMPLPPEREQVDILNFLVDSLDGIDALELEAGRAITLLKERRSALIAAAVTGQIDVRGMVSREQELPA